MTDEQRRSILNFADRLEQAFVPIIREMREAKTVGEGKRLIKRVDGAAKAILSA